MAEPAGRLLRFDYAVVRVVPRVERGECVNAGVLLHCRSLDFLAAAVDAEEARWLALDGHLDPGVVRAHLAALQLVCAGIGPAGSTTPGERFRWLTAPRSTVVQAGPVHGGVTTDPAAELARLAALLLGPPGPPGPHRPAG